jgi:hypothetical protein
MAVYLLLIQAFLDCIKSTTHYKYEEVFLHNNPLSPPWRKRFCLYDDCSDLRIGSTNDRTAGDYRSTLTYLLFYGHLLLKLDELDELSHPYITTIAGVKSIAYSSCNYSRLRL